MPTEPRPSEYDSPWKAMLTHFFPAFMQFFYADIHAAIDWRRGFEFLDKELEKIAVDGATGRRLADKLVKVWLLDGREVWVLVHVEVQGAREAGFARRMFTYHYRIFDTYGQRVVSLAILTDENAHWRPDEFSYELFGTGVRLRFRTVKLLDYADRTEELAVGRNPFAVIVTAHLKTLETRRAPEQRYRIKLEMVKNLHARGFRGERIRQLFRFIDWVMTLPRELENRLDMAIKSSREPGMEYISNFERFAMERGKIQGIEQGVQQGVQSVTLRLLQRRIGELSPTVVKRIKRLSVEQLEGLSDALLDFTTKADLNEWLREHGKKNHKTKGTKN